LRKLLQSTTTQNMSLSTSQTFPIFKLIFLYSFHIPSLQRTKCPPIKRFFFFYQDKTFNIIENYIIKNNSYQWTQGEDYLVIKGQNVKRQSSKNYSTIKFLYEKLPISTPYDFFSLSLFFSLILFPSSGSGPLSFSICDREKEGLTFCFSLCREIQKWEMALSCRKSFGNWAWKEAREKLEPCFCRHFSACWVIRHRLALWILPQRHHVIT